MIEPLATSSIDATEPARDYLSPYERDLWLHDQFNGGNGYSVDHCFRFDGPVDAERLSRAMASLVRAHPRLGQVIRPAPTSGYPFWSETEWATETLLRCVDLGDTADESAAISEIEDFLREPHQQRSPFAVCLVGIDGGCLIGLRVHHTLVDSVGFAVLCEQFSARYDRSAMLDVAVPPAHVGMKRNSTTVRGFVGEYWPARLAGAALPTRWPPDVDLNDPSVGDTVATPIEAASANRLRRLARLNETTPYLVLLNAWMMLLSIATGADDVVIGCPVTQRDPGDPPSLDYRANTVPIRQEFSTDASFASSLSALTDTFGRDREHGDVPFGAIARALSPSGVDAADLIGSLFVVEDDLPRCRLGDEVGRTIEVHNGSAKFPLTLAITSQGAGLHVLLEYRTSAYSAASATAILTNFVRLLEIVVTTPSVSQADVRRILADSNPADVTSADDARAILSRFDQQVAAYPASVAIEHGRHTLSYAELDERSRAIAAQLHAAGALPGDVVAVAVGRSLDLYASVLGVLRSRCAYLPLDLHYPDARLRFMLENAGCRLVLADAARVPASLLGLGRSTWLSPGAEPVPAVEAGGEQRVAVAPEGEADGIPEDVALTYVIYTSGSTGEPKGVEMPHGPLRRMVDWQLMRSAAGVGARTLQFAAISFDVAFQELFSTFCAGGTLVVIDEDVRRDVMALGGFLDDREVNRLFLPFVGLQALADSCALAERWPSHLREVITAGEQLVVTPSIRRFFAETGASLDNQYGPTETHVVTANQLAGSPTSWPNLPDIGHPLPYVQLDLLDPDGEPVLPGVAGEICIGGPALALGYRGRSEARFADGPRGRFYRTGDIGRRWRADGPIQYLGREDGQVKIRGHRIELGEIEAAMLRLPDVSQAVVVSADDRPGSRHLVGFVTTSARLVDGAELRLQLRRLLPDHMVPSVVMCVETIPTTPNGKIDRAALTVAAAARPDLAAPAKSFVRSQDSLELHLGAAFYDVLRLTAEPDQSFFDAGGDSFSALRLIAHIEKTAGVRLSLAELVANPTVTDLARRLRDTGGHLSTLPLVQLRAGSSERSMFMFHPLPGTVIRYLPLTRQLRTGVRIWGLQSPGIEPGERPCRSIDEMTGRYVEAIRTIQPDGPWVLLGYSMGGVLALEAARQLDAATPGLSFVGLLDSSPPGSEDDSLTFALTTLLTVAFGIANPDVAALLRIPPDERAAEVTRLGLASGALAEHDDPQRAERLLAMYQLNARALSGFAVTPYAGPAHLFRAVGSVGPATEQEWIGLIAELSVCDVPGDHLSMMEPGNVEAMAMAIDESLGRWAVRRAGR